MPEDSKSRKERLKALRQAAQDAQTAGQSDETTAKGDAPESSEAPVLKFRNYALKDANIEHAKVGCLLYRILDKW
jgi:hypothetical protein